MPYKVVESIKGNTLRSKSRPTPGNKEGEPLSKEAAEAFAKQANIQAEELGIKTRYSVEEMTS